MRHTTLLSAGLAVAGIMFDLPAAHAQTGPALLQVPYKEGQKFDFDVDLVFLNKGKTDVRAGGAGNADFKLDIYEAEGRFKFPDAPLKNLSVGFELDYLDISSSDPALPQRLVDQRISVGATLGVFEGWEVAAVLGVGYAGNNPFADAEALYAMADVIFTLKLDERSKLNLGINYHGNRSIVPDVPLPTASYWHKVDDTFEFTIGIPVSNLIWKPVEKLTVELFYIPIYTIDAKIAYELIQHVTVFGAFKNRYSAFTIDQDFDNRRVFFQQRRIEAGVEWQVCKNFGVTLAGGYAFSQKFEHGFDVTDADSIVEVGDEPYFRAAVNIGF